MSRVLIILGFLFLLSSSFLLWQQTRPIRVSFKSVSITQASPPSQIRPTGIKIPRISVSLPIVSTKIINGQWQDSKTGVAHLETSPIPGQTGNSILYGHNWSNLLGRLNLLRSGDEIEIVFDDQTSKKFLVTYTQIVTPDQVSILNPTKDVRLTLYTCTGFLDSKRFVVVASPI
jgi:sortase A